MTINVITINLILFAFSLLLNKAFYRSVGNNFKCFIDFFTDDV